jgi:hypothetical protein
MQYVRIGLFCDEAGKRSLHPRGGITQKLQILHRPGRIADLQLNAMAREYARVLSCEALVLRSWGAGCHRKMSRWKRID